MDLRTPASLGNLENAPPVRHEGPAMEAEPGQASPLAHSEHMEAVFDASDSGGDGCSF